MIFLFVLLSELVRRNLFQAFFGGGSQFSLQRTHKMSKPLSSGCLFFLWSLYGVFTGFWTPCEYTTWNACRFCWQYFHKLYVCLCISLSGLQNNTWDCQHILLHFAESQLTPLHPFKSSQKSFANAHWSATALLLYLKIAFLNSCS